MTIERITLNGYIITDIVGGYLITKSYHGYTKREAIRLFKESTK